MSELIRCLESDIHVWARSVVHSIDEHAPKEEIETKLSGMRDDLRIYIAQEEPNYRTRLLMQRYFQVATWARNRMYARDIYRRNSYKRY